MDLSIYTAELRESLQAAASLGDDNSQRAAGALAAALEPAARLALMHALSDFAAEVTAHLNIVVSEPVSVDVRLEGRDLRVVAVRHGATPDAAAPTADAGAEEPDRTFADASGDLTRTTVRMFNELKGRAEKAAAEQGVSLNSFISRAVADSIKTDLPRKFRERERHDRHGRGDGEDKGHSSYPKASPSTISGYVQG